MAISKALESATREWIAGDPDEETRAELESLMQSGDMDELTDRMDGSLEFGTAGLRGRVEAGSNRMNRAVVIRTTRGLADHLIAVQGGSVDSPVVVGYDARLSSATFMRDTVGVLAAAGIPVRFFDDVVPTPIVAFAARTLGAAAAIVITASHNPPRDNGYKVYAPNAAQIVPPLDSEIATAIAAVGPAASVPRISKVFDDRSDLVDTVPADLFERYLAEIGAVRSAELGGTSSGLKIVYTPMHGVGGRFVVEALEHFGYTQVHPVEEQFAPDGHFPTVDFPNPEEPGALDLAEALAADLDADLILANDPDTDRLAVSVRWPDGQWRGLTGNQIGVLLTDYMLEITQELRPIVLNSVVSSPMLASIAESRGALYERTLTGFKWIWNAALDLEGAGRGRFVCGYEEALGYSVGRMVRDKDGISAAVLLADLAASGMASGGTLVDKLNALYRKHGVWVSTQKSAVRSGADGAEQMEAAMDLVRRSPPEILAGHPVVGVTDFMEDAAERPRYLGATNLMALDLGERGRALVRPSGTEPKIKVYVDLTAAVIADGEPSAVEAELMADAEATAGDLMRQMGFGDGVDGS